MSHAGMRLKMRAISYFTYIIYPRTFMYIMYIIHNIYKVWENIIAIVTSNIAGLCTMIKEKLSRELRSMI
jgi:hypothetical protein